ncbi:MAG: hypothetical protein NC489_40990, partial [Ruminococcus flavefaciens]|nr:hypothetical protein [Ruminococcus flavefaciens]
TSSVTAAGVYKVTVTFTVDTSNYNPVASKTATLTIEKASYDMSAVELEDDTVVYDGALHTLVIKDLTALPTDVSVKETVYTNKATGAKVTDTGVSTAGEYTVSVSFNITDSTNYKAVSDLTATLKITKAQTVIDVSGMVKTYTYDGYSHTINDATLTAHEAGAVIEYSSNNTFKDVPVGGKLTVTVSVKDSTNYIGASETVEITVNKVALTITANNKTIFYGDAPANDGIKSAVGFVTVGGVSETVADDLSGSAVYTYDYAQGGNAGGYKIKVSGYTSKNYDITYVDGALTVLAKSVKVNWTSETYTFDGKGHAPTATFDVVSGGKQNMDVKVAIKGGADVASAVAADTYVATAYLTSPNTNYTFTDDTYEFTINPAKIVVTGTGDSFRQGGNTEITIDATENGKYKFIVLQGNVAGATITYSNAHDATGSYPTPDGETTYSATKPTVTAAGSYVVNYCITATNHSEYRGQWTVEITDETVKSVTVNFVKPYSVEFGSVPETDAELNALAQELVDGGYVEIDGLDAADFLQAMQLRLRVDNKNNATADTGVGRYTPYFECKTGFETVYGEYVVFYKAENVADDTNVGKFEIKQKQLTVTWDSVGFVADGTLHLPTATVSGFNDGTTAELALDSADGKTFEVEKDGKTLKFTVNVSGDLTSAGGHQLIVSVDDGNYSIDKQITTVSISAPVQLTVAWENTNLVYDGELHLPKATVSGFAGGKTFEFALLTAEGGKYSYSLNSTTVEFTVTVSGSGNVFTDVGVYALNVSTNSANYVIKNPTASVTITAPRKLVVTWNQTSFDEDGTQHLPKALISGFNSSDPVTIELKAVSGGVFKVKADGKDIVFTVSVVGLGQLLKDAGNYTVTLTVDTTDYVIDNPDVAMSVRALAGGDVEVEGKLSKPWLIGIAAALGVLFIMIIISYIVAAKRKAVGGGVDEGGFSEPYNTLDFMESAPAANAQEAESDSSEEDEDEEEDDE